MEQRGAVDFEGLLTGLVESSEQLREQYRKVLGQRLFLASALLKKRLGSSLGSDDTLVLDARLYWKLPKEVQQDLTNEPLFAYAVNRLIYCATNQAHRGEVAQLRELLGTLIVDVYLRREGGFAIEEPIPISCTTRGRLRLPNRPTSVGLEPAAPSATLRVTADETGLTLRDEDGNRHVLSAEEYTREAEMALLEGGLRLETGPWYRSIGEQVVGKYSVDGPGVDSVSPFPDSSVSRVSDRFNRALKIIGKCAPETFADLQSHTHVIVAIDTPAASGFSVDTCRGAVFVTAEENVIDTIDHLVHENGHNKLDTINDLYPLLAPMDGEVFLSPWRTDLRPMIGLLHGAYVFTVVGHTLLRVAPKLPDFETMVPPVVGLYRRQVADALETIDRHAKLTAAGQEFVDNLRFSHQELAV